MEKRTETHPKELIIHVKAGPFLLEGGLVIPEGAKGIVLFAHGSGSSRHSPRNQFVAKTLNKGGLATLLIDLLTSEEEEIDVQTAELRFDIPLLAERLVAATDWLQNDERTKRLGVCYFGASTGAAAALVAGASKGKIIKAIVSRGGRPDLASASLSRVQTPTLLIVGENDFQVIKLNQRAYEQLKSEKKMEIVPKATHLFEEPGALEEVGRLALMWFKDHLEAL